ncbi:MFS transporter [Haloterrigena alkaliphila]|uniref:MFS transporter n=1 Tax=Haloterrigena alkaliphila TaxID=2816475 RepID=A0A8A2VD20_9EURY|nr:MFS transporter [Haloterrigena alkaliphila]QSW99106.1 MFS transporter [Haloterrigena alkaliphila]
MSDRWLYAWGLGSAAFGGVSVIVPLYVVSLGADPFTLGILAAAAAFAGVPGALAFGGLADRTGKRRMFVVAALSLVAVMSVAIPFTRSIAVVIAANATVWFASAAVLPILTLLAVADAPDAQWSERIARLNTYQGVGWALGLLAGTVWTVGAARVLGPVAAQRGFLLACAACAALSCLASVRTLPPDPEPGAEPEPRKLRRAMRRAGRFNVRGVTFPFSPVRVDPRGLHPRRVAHRFTPELTLYFLAIVLVFAGSAAFFAPLPAFLAELGYGSDGIFALYLLSSVASAVCFDRVGRLAAAHDARLVQVAGLLGRAIGLPAAAVVGTALGVTRVGLVGTTVVFAVIGITWAVISVTTGTIVTQLAPAGVRGEALGVYSALTAFAGGVGSVAGGWLAASSYAVAFTVAGGLVLAGAGVVLALWRRTITVAEPDRSVA